MRILPGTVADTFEGTAGRMVRTMIATTPKSMTLTKRGLEIFVTLAFAFCMALAMGVAPAYAEGDNSPALEDNGSEAPANLSSPQLDAETLTVGAAASDNAPAASLNDSDGPSSDLSLGAAGDSAYPGDDRTMNVFVGLVPETTPSYNAESAVRDSETNALHVYISSEVGKGVDLDVAVDYIRIGENVYDASGGAGVTAQLPSATTDAYTMTSFKQGLMYTWYINGSPLGQGTYYSDPSTNPALGGSSVGDSSNLTQYSGVSVEDFMLDKSTQWGVSPSSYTSNTPVRFIKSVPYAYYSFDGSIELLEINKGHDETGAFDSHRYTSSPLFFESPGMRTIVAQFTYMQEYRSRNSANENVGYVVYASNPVIFHISIAPSSQTPANLTIVASDADTGEPVDISSNEFFVDLQKDYMDGYRMADESGGMYEWLRYAFCSTDRNTYACATPGLYKLTVTHVDNLYQQYIEYFKISEGMVSGGSFDKRIVLEPYVPPAQYSVTFYQEDGVTVIPVSGTDESGNYVTVDSRMYNEGTAAERVWAPPHPTKAATEYAKYVFEQWRAEAADGGTIDTFVSSYDYVYPVTCNTKYIAVFRTIPLKNNAGQSIVYATGGLFSNDALPSGVLSYGMTSAPLTDAKKSGIIASHSSMMAAESVLGMVQVDLTQYNDDAGSTTTNVTEHEGLEGMKLKFNMQESGINASEGDKLKVLQIHKKDESSSEEIIEHKATVINGEVEITLNGKLSTFVFMKDDSSSSTFPGDTNPSQDVFIGILPKNTGDFTYSRYTGEDASEASGYTPCTSSSGTQFSLDANNVAHVYLESEVGKGVDLNVAIEYLRANGIEYDVSGKDNLRVPGYPGDPAYYVMYNWYEGGAPLAAGIYTTSEGQVLDNGSGEAAPLGITIGTGENAIHAIAFTPYAESYVEAPNNRLLHSFAYPFYYDYELYGGLDSVDTRFPLYDQMNGNNAYRHLYFESSGQYTYTAQLTFAKEIRTETVIDGVPCTVIRYEIFFSNPVAFHINVSKAQTAKLVITAKDDSGKDLDITKDTGDFNLYLSKQYVVPADEEGREWRPFAQCGWDSTYTPATAGVYSLRIIDKNGNHYEFNENFEITAAQISAAAAGDGTVHQEIVIKKIPEPVPCTVAFFDEDGTTELLVGKVYNKNTLASEVEKPENPTKAEDDKYLYVFKWWEVDTDGVKSYSDTVLDVMGDMTYRAVYTAIPKENETVVNRVIAAGGLLDGGKPVGVSSYGLRVSSPDVNSDAVYELAQKYAPYIGSNRIAGVFEVNLIQYDTSGETHDLTEGLGDMTLDLPVDGVADGTKIKVIQLHADNYGGVQVYEHDLVVKNGKAHVLLNGRLSTFIVAVAPDEKAVDPDNGGQNGNGSGENGSSGNQGGTTNGNTSNGASGTSGEESSKTPVADPEAGVDPAFPQDADKAASGADEALTEPVKAAPAAGDAALPATGDPASPAVLVLAALALLAAATALTVRTRRRTQL